MSKNKLLRTAAKLYYLQMLRSHQRVAAKFRALPGMVQDYFKGRAVIFLGMQEFDDNGQPYRLNIRRALRGPLAGEWGMPSAMPAR